MVVGGASVIGRAHGTGFCGGAVDDDPAFDGCGGAVDDEEGSVVVGEASRSVVAVVDDEVGGAESVSPSPHAATSSETITNPAAALMIVGRSRNPLGSAHLDPATIPPRPPFDELTQQLASPSEQLDVGRQAERRTGREDVVGCAGRAWGSITVGLAA